MKKLLLLSAVMAGLSACGGSQDLKNTDYVKVHLPTSGVYQKDTSTGGRRNGNHAGDKQAIPNYRDGVEFLNYVGYGLATTPAGVVTTHLFDGADAQKVAAPTSGTAYYSGTLLHAGRAMEHVHGTTVHPYDVSGGEIALKMDFANKTFQGSANAVPVQVADKALSYTLDTSGAKTYTGSTDLSVLTAADRTYTMNGTISGTGYTGTATITEQSWTNEYNDTAKAYVTGRNSTVAPVVISGATVEGSFYGANAAETVGTIKASDGKYNAIFGARRSD